MKLFPNKNKKKTEPPIPDREAVIPDWMDEAFRKWEQEKNNRT